MSTHAYESCLAYTRGGVKVSLLHTSNGVWDAQMRFGCAFLQPNKVRAFQGLENEAGWSFVARVFVFKPWKMSQSRDIVHPGCKIEMTLELHGGATGCSPLLPVRICTGRAKRRKILRFKIAILPLLMPLV